MVQRKVEQDKLGIQANLLKHDQYHNQNSLKKPPSSHHQDGKTVRGPEVKKKVMKKSRSFKLSDISQKTLKSSSLSSSSRHVPKSLEASPNYMKPTTCSDAKKELQSKASNLARNLTKTPSFKLSVIGSAKKCSKSGLCASPAPGHVDVQRPTCSSTLKDSKFPSYLTLAHGGTGSEGNSVVKVCPYTYCSLNGHLHKYASLPPLKCFLSAKRSALKPRRSSELAEDRAGIELFVRNCAEKEARDFEIRAEEPLERASEEIGAVEASDMEVEEDEAADISSEMDEDSESVSGSSSEIEDEVIQELFSTDDDEFEDLSGGGETEAKEMGGAFEAEEDETLRNDENDQVCDASQKTNDDHDQVSSEESKDTPSRNQAGDMNISIFDEEEEDESKKREKGKREAKESSSGGDEEREFNPREPNYLPLAVDPDGEKVELKHQDMDERKNSEEWMIDRALQQTVTKLGPARKRRVALLVEAFETVAPVTKREAFHRLTNHHHHHHHPTSPVFQNPIWPIQACN